jgi:hypothetical protein
MAFELMRTSLSLPLIEITHHASTKMWHSPNSITPLPRHRFT